MKTIRQTFPKIRTYVRRRKRRYEVDARGQGVGLGVSAGDRSPSDLALGTEDDFLTLASPAVPRLTVLLEATPPRRLKVRWPASAVGYVLESAGSLSARNFTAASEVPVVEGTDNLVLIDLNGANRFFRLVKR